MELIKVNSAKLKIILTAEDMAELNMSGESFDYSTPLSKKAFWEILDKAKRKTGFDAHGSQLEVQFYPSRGGGGEMYITLTDDSAKETAAQSKKRIRSEFYESEREYIALTEKLENLILLCRRLLKEEKISQSILYADNKKYYLYLKVKPTRVGFGSQTASSAAFPLYVCEYASVLTADKIRKAYLEEHTKKICPSSAVEIICEKFV